MICEKNQCTGCFACVNICPENCIEMDSSQDMYGAIYPVIDREKCINCKLCEKVCPAINQPEFRLPFKTYAAYVKDVEKRRESTSGGIATMLAEYVINEGGVVYGAALNENITFSHKRIDKIGDLSKIRGSKYNHSYIENTYSLAKKDLDRGLKVCFVGTPCQIGGLKKYLKKEYDNLLTIDLICHGVPARKVFSEYFKWKFSEFKENIDIIFRYRYGLCMAVKRNEQIVRLIKGDEDYYINGFIKGFFYRENCYSCVYAQKKRVGDITLGDFWGLGREKPFEGDRSDGCNAVLINTKKGSEAFKHIKDSICVYERELDEAVKGNHQLRSPSEKNQYYYRFKELYVNKGMKYAFVNTDKSFRKKAFLRRIVRNNKAIEKIVKKIPVVKNKF